MASFEGVKLGAVQVRYKAAVPDSLWRQPFGLRENRYDCAANSGVERALQSAGCTNLRGRPSIEFLRAGRAAVAELADARALCRAQGFSETEDVGRTRPASIVLIVTNADH